MKTEQAVTTWTIERKSERSYELRITIPAGQRDAYILLASDGHVDNKLFDQRLWQRHHEQAIEIGAPIFHFGDLFCAMQGKWDRRADQNELIPELRGNKYLDLLVEHVHGKVRKYEKHYALISKGNHEGSILDRHQTDLIERLVDRMRQGNSPVVHGAYAGFVRIVIEQEHRSGTQARDLFYHHGYGGGGEVTRGLIDNSRMRGQWEADIYYQGHIHRRNVDLNDVAYLARNGEVKKREQIFIRGGAYKVDDEAAWHIGTGKGPRPRGGWWVRFRWIRTPDKNKASELEVTPLADL